MHSSSAQYEIPEFLKEQTIFCDNLMHSHQKRKSKSCLVLARNLKFYEFQRKQLLNTIDLSTTCLRNEEITQRLRDYQGPQSKWFKPSACPSKTLESALLSESTLQQDTAASADISFGKYIYTYCGQASKLYLLLHCWDKLLVLQRLEDSTASGGFQLTAEWEHVKNYKLVHGKLKFHAVVEIKFEDGRRLRTDFNNQRSAAGADPPKEDTTTTTHQKDFKLLLERVRSTKTELQLHKATTQMEFERLRDTQAFGRNLLRSLKLEEKQIVARCGDVWLRFTAADALVIGVPLVNNCTAPNLTILRNLRAVFKIDGGGEGVRGINYEQRFFRLKQSFEHLETLETFFQCAAEDEEWRRRTTDNSWTCDQQLRLLPEAFAVLVLKLRISQIVALERCPLFLLFEIEKEMDLGMGPKTKTFEHQIFLHKVNFPELLRRRHAYEVTFCARTLHQDFLAIACSNTETKLNIKFASANDLAKFEQLLAAKFDCEMLKRGGDNENYKKSMQVDEDDADEKNLPPLPPNSAEFFRHFLFYNQKPASLWHGLLALRVATASDALDDLATSTIDTHWKFYTPNAERAFLLAKLLFEELLLNGCNVVRVACPTHQRRTTLAANDENDDARRSLLEFENALRQELCALLQLVNEKSSKSGRPTAQVQQFADLAKLQLQTDLLAATLR